MEWNIINILLEKNDINICYEFAVKAWGNQSQKHFGGTPRTKKQFIADQIEGKMAELVLMKFLAEKGLNINLDFQHYEGEHNTDNGDFMIAFQDRLIETKVDIKGSSNFAQWLLVEDYKFIDPRTKQRKSDAFVMVCFGDSFPGNRALRENPQIIIDQEYEAQVKGWAAFEDFYETGNRGQLWFEWTKGSLPWNQRVLPKTFPFNRRGLENYLAKSIPSTEERGGNTRINIQLDANINYGLPIKWLRTDWDEFTALFPI